MAAPMGRTCILRKALKVNLKNRSFNVRHYLSSTTIFSDDTDPHASLAEQFAKANNRDILATKKRVNTPFCKTTKIDPNEHTLKDVGLFYHISDTDASRWLSKVFHNHFTKMCKAFTETRVMVREPAVEIINYLKAANYNLPAIRYVLYGGHGCGKSTTLGHAMHFCGSQGWLILHVPFAGLWNRFYRELVQSTYNSSRYDHTKMALDWLSLFRQMNEPLIKEINAVTQNRYIWNKRESCEVGTSWLEPIEFAFGRPKYASDVVGLILKEAKQLSNDGKIKTLVAIDGVNAFWMPTTYKRPLDGSQRIHAQEISLVHNFKKMLKNDWRGGAVVVTVDRDASMIRDEHDVKKIGVHLKKDVLVSDMPKYLLTKEGFEWLDPYIPVKVSEYNDKELLSCLEYLREKHWILNPKGETEIGEAEIAFLSCNNPKKVIEVTRMW